MNEVVATTEEKDLVVATAAAVTPTNKAKGKRKKLNTHNSEQRVNLFKQKIKSFIPGIQPDLINNVATNAERLWCLMYQSEAYLKSKRRYQEEYHVLVIANFMKSSYSPLGQQIIPVNKFMFANLPKIRNIPNVKVQLFTTSKKLFDDCISELLTKSDHFKELPWRN